LDSFNDPLTGAYFTYATNPSLTQYQLATFLENLSLKSGIIDQTFAANRYIMTLGKTLGIVLSGTTPVNEDASIKAAGYLDVKNTSLPYTVQFRNSVVVTGTGSTINPLLASVTAGPRKSCKSIMDT
jgi:hypothetical protein